MQDQQFLKRFLRLNEISSDASDAEISEALTSAKWTDAEIKTAIMLIRGKPYDLGVVAVTKKNMTLFRPDMNMSSERLSSLLGVDVIIDPTKIRDVSTNELVLKAHVRQEFLMWCAILLLSLLLAAFALWTLMVTMQFGPYQPPHHII